MRHSERLCVRQFKSPLATSSAYMVIMFVVLLSDTVIAGNFFGDDAIAAVSLVTPVFSFTAFIAAMISVGTSVCYSVAMGAFDKNRADALFGQSVILSVGAGLLLFALTFFGGTAYFGVLSPSAQVLRGATQYYSAYPYLALIYPLNAVLTDMIFVDGDELVCNISYAVQIVGNIVCSLVLGRLMGMAGISCGTLAGTALSALVLSSHFLRKRSSLHFVWSISLRSVLNVAKFGLTDGEQFLCNALLLYVMNAFVISAFGSAMLPVLSVMTGMLERRSSSTAWGRCWRRLSAFIAGRKTMSASEAWCARRGAPQCSRVSRLPRLWPLSRNISPACSA